MKTRIYTVIDRAAGRELLIRASSPAQALRHVAAATYQWNVASQDDLERLLGAGVRVQAAADDGQAQLELDSEVAA